MWREVPVGVYQLTVRADGISTSQAVKFVIAASAPRTLTLTQAASGHRYSLRVGDRLVGQHDDRHLRGDRPGHVAGDGDRQPQVLPAVRVSEPPLHRDGRRDWLSGSPVEAEDPPTGANRHRPKSGRTEISARRERYRTGMADSTCPPTSPKWRRWRDSSRHRDSLSETEGEMRGPPDAVT